MALNLKKMVLGGFLLLLAVFCALTAIYYLEVEPAAREPLSGTSELEGNKGEILSAEDIGEVRDATDMNRELAPSLLASAPVVVAEMEPRESGVTLDSLVEHAENIYDEAEKNRVEGFLWVDRNSSRYVVTLGALNGIFPGAYLTVYDEDRKVGQVQVETTMDVIAYVKPEASTEKSLTKEYYRVVRQR